MNDDLHVAGRRALVTGGTKGVGAAVVKVLHELGVRVIATARTLSQDSLPNASYVAANLTTTQGCAKVCDAVIKKFKGVDFIIHVLGGSSSPAGGYHAREDRYWRQEYVIDGGTVPSV